MQRNELMSEGMAFAAAAIGTAAGTYLTDAVDMTKSGEVLFLIDAPTVGTTVDFQVLASSTAAGTYAAVAGTQIVTMTTPGKAKVCVRGWKLDNLNTGQLLFVKGQLVTVGATVAHVVGVASKAHYKPDSDQDLPAVTQTVVL